MENRTRGRRSRMKEEERGGRGRKGGKRERWEGGGQRKRSTPSYSFVTVFLTFMYLKRERGDRGDGEGSSTYSVKQEANQPDSRMKKFF